MVCRNRIRDALQEHRLTGAGRGDDQSTLALADRGNEIEHAAAVVILRRLHLEAIAGVQGREVVEEDFVAGFFGRLVVDRVDLDEGEVAFAFLGRTDLAADRVAGAKVEAADLRRRHIDVVGTRQVVVLGSAQEAEAVGQAFEDALGEDESALFGLALQDLEDQFLLAEAGHPLHAHVFGELVQVLDAHVFQIREVEHRLAALLLDRGTGAHFAGEHFGSARRLRRRGLFTGGLLLRRTLRLLLSRRLLSALLRRTLLLLRLPLLSTGGALRRTLRGSGHDRTGHDGSLRLGGGSGGRSLLLRRLGCGRRSGGGGRRRMRLSRHNGGRRSRHHCGGGRRRRDRFGGGLFFLCGSRRRCSGSGRCVSCCCRGLWRFRRRSRSRRGLRGALRRYFCFPVRTFTRSAFLSGRGGGSRTRRRRSGSRGVRRGRLRRASGGGLGLRRLGGTGGSRRRRLRPYCCV